MSDEAVQIAIETSSRHGRVAVGRGAQLLEEVELEQQRHAVHLLPALDDLAKRHGFRPVDIEAIHVSVGPGSFTGLRVALTVAKMLHRVTGAKLVAVPTLDVVAQNVPVEHQRAAVCLNAKKGNCYTGLYERQGVNDWRRITEPALWSPDELLEHATLPLAIVADKLPPFDRPEQVTILSPEVAVPRASVVYRLGRALAAAGRYADAYQLTPLYIRQPEAEEVWQARRAAAGAEAARS